ncbi:hypothetical protein BOW29_08105 [Solemya velum gill symbiont]|nr:hypothetical protein BOW29_08105 [Solemya velum gill symbiont]
MAWQEMSSNPASIVDIEVVTTVDMEIDTYSRIEIVVIMTIDISRIARIIAIRPIIIIGPDDTG